MHFCVMATQSTADWWQWSTPLIDFGCFVNYSQTQMLLFDQYTSEKGGWAASQTLKEYKLS